MQSLMQDYYEIEFYHETILIGIIHGYLEEDEVDGLVEEWEQLSEENTTLISLYPEFIA